MLFLDDREVGRLWTGWYSRRYGNDRRPAATQKDVKGEEKQAIICKKDKILTLVLILQLINGLCSIIFAFIAIIPDKALFWLLKLLVVVL